MFEFNLMVAAPLLRNLTHVRYFAAMQAKRSCSDVARPCRRCVSHGFGDECVEAPDRRTKPFHSRGPNKSVVAKKARTLVAENRSLGAPTAPGPPLWKDYPTFTMNAGQQSWSGITLARDADGVAPPPVQLGAIRPSRVFLWGNGGRPAAGMEHPAPIPAADAFRYFHESEDEVQKLLSAVSTGRDSAAQIDIATEGDDAYVLEDEARIAYKFGSGEGEGKDHTVMSEDLLPFAQFARMSPFADAEHGDSDCCLKTADISSPIGGNSDSTSVNDFRRDVDTTDFRCVSPIY